MVVSMLLKGNAYILITRDTGGEVSNLTLLNSDSVIIDGSNNNISYKDSISNKTYDKSQIIHLMNNGETLYRGESTISYMANSLSINNNLENYLLSLTRSGMMVSGILKPTTTGGNITPEKAIKAKTAFNNSINSLEANSVIVLDSGFDFQQISISPKDAKYLESSKMNSNNICKFFGVPPAMIYDEVGKYSTAEQSQIDYLNNTLTPIIEKIESEFFRKIYLQPD